MKFKLFFLFLICISSVSAIDIQRGTSFYDALYCQLTGCSMAGSLNMDSNNITNINRLSAPDGSSIQFSAPSPFVAFDQSTSIISNQTFGLGVITHSLLDQQGQKVLRTWQSGKNNSAGYMGNSQIIAPNNLTLNGTQLSDCFFVMDALGIPIRVGCDTAETGADLVLQDDFLLGGTVFAEMGIRAENLANFVMNGNQFDILNGSMHVNNPVNFDRGFEENENITKNEEIFEGNLGEFNNLQSDFGNWLDTADILCDEGDCARANGAGAGLITMEGNFSTLDLNQTHVEFVYSLINILGGDNGLSVTANNNTVGSSDETIFTDGTNNVALQQESIELGTSMDNQTSISLRFTCDVSASKPSRACFVDTIKIRGTTTTNTTLNIDGFDSKIVFGDGELDLSGIPVRGIYYNASADLIQFRGGAESITVNDEIIIGDLTVGGTTTTNNILSENWGNVTITESQITDLQPYLVNYDNLVLNNDSTTLSPTWDVANYTAGSGIDVTNHVITNTRYSDLTNVAFINNTQNFALEQTIGGGWPNGISLRPDGDALIGRDLYVGGQIVPVDGSSVNGSFFPLSDALGDLGKVNSSGSFRWGNLYLKDLLQLNGTADIDTLRVTGSGDSSFEGNVGIGTTSPARLLEVFASGDNAHIQLNASGTDKDSFLDLCTSDQDNCGFISTLNGDGLRFRASGSSDSSNMFITSTGNVGIGTTSPSELLHLVSSDQIIANFTSTNANGAGIAVFPTASGGRGYSIVSTADSAGAGAGKFVINDVLVGARMAIDSSGNIGIGTTAPTKRLTVLETASSSTVLVTNSHASTPWGINVDFSAAAPNDKTQWFMKNEDSGGVKSTLWSDGGATFAGNVGIGTTSPAIDTKVLGTGGTILTIDGGSGVLGAAEIGMSTTTDDEFVGAVKFYNLDNSDAAGATSHVIGIIGTRMETSDANAGDDSGGHLVFWAKPESGSAAEKMRITSAGNIGIGTTAPTHKLNVVGDVNITSTLEVNSKINIGNTILFRDTGSDILAEDNTNHYIKSPADLFVQVNTGGTTITHEFDTTGKFSINGTSPATHLQIGKSSDGQGNITMFSSDGNSWNCGVDNTGAFTCS